MKRVVSVLLFSALFFVVVLPAVAQDAQPAVALVVPVIVQGDQPEDVIVSGAYEPGGDSGAEPLCNLSMVVTNEGIIVDVIVNMHPQGSFPCSEARMLARSIQCRYIGHCI